MNFLPSLQKPRRNFRFSNPLSGLVYNNNSYLKQCHYELQEELGNMSNRNTVAHPRKPKSPKKRMNKTAFASRTGNQVMNKTDRGAMEMVKTTDQKGFVSKTNRASEQKYNFKDIDIKILDAINSIKDCKTKVLKINLSHYFGVFFKKALLGHLTCDFMAIVEKYIQGLIKNKQLDTPIDTRDHPPDIFKINNKRTFVSRVEELEEIGQYKSAEAMVKFYCVPNVQFRESCFRDIIHMLSRSLFQNFNMNKHKQYVLLNEEGTILHELCQIKFSTSVLMITQSENYEKTFAKYQNILVDNDMSFQRLSFSQGIKKTFRSRIACGKVDETKQKPIFNQTQANLQKVKKIQQLLHKKSDKAIKPFSPSKTMANFSPKSPYKHEQKRSGAKTHLQNRSIVSQVQITPIDCRRRHQEYKTNFDQLINHNSKYDITFNHLNENRLLMPVFIQYYPLFKNKSKDQISAILKAININENEESIGWEEFKKISEVSNCKGDKDNIINFINRYLPFNDFGELDRKSLRKTLQFILSGDSNVDVVEQVVWSWLQKNGLVDNGVVIKTTLESWYEKNKLAYGMLVSLIFGTNQITTIDMAYEVLV